MQQEIGLLTVSYDEKGHIQLVRFRPTMEITLDNTDIESQLGSVVESPIEVTDLQDNADRVLAAWFNAINSIELADRDKYEIRSEVKKCEKYPASGNIKTCVLEYKMVELDRV